MKKVFSMVIVAVIAMVAVMATGCNEYDKEAYIECKGVFETARDFGCMTWDTHYYGYNSRDMAEVEREVMKRNGIVCTEIKTEYGKGRVVYYFETLNSRV